MRPVFARLTMVTTTPADRFPTATRTSRPRGRAREDGIANIDEIRAGIGRANQQATRAWARCATPARPSEAGRPSPRTSTAPPRTTPTTRFAAASEKIDEVRQALRVAMQSAKRRRHAGSDPPDPRPSTIGPPPRPHPAPPSSTSTPPPRRSSRGGPTPEPGGPRARRGDGGAVAAGDRSPPNTTELAGAREPAARPTSSPVARGRARVPYLAGATRRSCCGHRRRCHPRPRRSDDPAEVEGRRRQARRSARYRRCGRWGPTAPVEGATRRSGRSPTLLDGAHLRSRCPPRTGSGARP
ncbi:hypothetical protein HBB16_12940 [Pseudonocardia sp. MCCB 268]|nr:hypothetical protein [Pseudonocardia cytotoxica]